MSSATTVRSPLAANPAWHIALCAGLCLTLGACASRTAKTSLTPISATAPAARGGEAIARLRRLAQQQLSTPDPLAMKVPLPKGMLTPSSAQPERASLPLAAALAQLPPLAMPAAPTQQTPSLTEPPGALERQIESSKHYVDGRSKLVAGQFAEAITQLEAAAKLDPTSTDILTELGMAQAAAGKRSAAAATYRRATALGLHDPRIAAFLGRETLRARRYDQAASELVQAASLAQTPDATLTLAVIRADLSDALYHLGYHRAAAEVLGEVLGSLATVPSGRLKPEEAELYRRRAELWQRAGDLHAAAGSLDEAGKAYEAASELPAGDSPELAQRRLYVQLAKGQSAQAALTILEQLAAPASRPASGQFELFTGIVGSSSIGTEIIDAAALVAGDATLISSATTRHRLIMAVTERTGASTPAARNAMRLYLLATPDISRDVARYCSLFDDDTPARTHAISQLCLARPDLGAPLARSLINYGRDIAGSMAWCEHNRRDDPGAWILANYLAIQLDAAPKEPELPLPPASTDPDVVASVRVAVNAARGKWDLVNASLQAVSPKCPAQLRASMLATAQHFAAALDAAAGLPEVFAIQQATWCMNVGRNDQAAVLLNAARERDPLDERPYEVLLNLYSPRAPLASDEKLGTTARLLREWVPDSRFAQSIAARDLASRNQWAQASDMLVGMLEPKDESGAVLMMLVSVCERSYKTDPAIAQRALTMVNDRLASRPDSPILIMAKAKLQSLLETGPDASGADLYLDQTIARLGLTELTRFREGLIRETLADAPRADAMARQRLAQSARGIDQAIEYASLLLRAGEYQAAADAIERGLPGDAQLTRDQSSTLLSLTNLIEPEKLVGAQPEVSRAALVLFDQIALRGITMTPSMHLSRLLVLCASASSDAPRVYAALQQAIKTLPDLAEQLPARVAQTLLSKPDPTDGLRFLAEFVNNAPTFPEQYAFEWFRIVFARGDKDDITDLVRLPKDPAALLKAISGSVDEDQVRVEGNELTLRSEIAYWIGNACSVESKEDLAEYAYRLALSLHADHAWSLNNLGYNLLIRDSQGSFDEATSMITRAYELLPDEPSVIDSFGWLKYRQGQFEDATLADGSPSPGAASVLSQAVNNLNKPASAEQCEHFGDALWRVGKKDDARTQWDNARRLIESQLALFRAAAQPGSPPRPQQLRLQEQAERIQSRLTAAAEGKPPPVSATYAEASKKKTP